MSGESICKQNELLHDAEILYERRIKALAKRTPIQRRNSIRAENLYAGNTNSYMTQNFNMDGESIRTHTRRRNSIRAENLYAGNTNSYMTQNFNTDGESLRKQYELIHDVEIQYGRRIFTQAIQTHT